MQSHRSLLANASHELRSPLARMKMAVSMLADATPDAARHAQARDRQQRRRARRTGRGGAARQPTRRAPRARCTATRSTCSRSPPRKRPACGASVADPSEQVFVAGDERLLRRAIRNLLENAQRYGGGEVEVGVAGAGAGAARRVSVQVSDRGPGVPDAMRERIFEPFFRLPGHAEQSGGVGLGLALVKQIVARHGGSVRCDARPGGGSRFVIDAAGRLRLSASAATPAVPRRCRCASRGAACRRESRSCRAPRTPGRASPSTRSRARRASMPG